MSDTIQRSDLIGRVVQVSGQAVDVLVDRESFSDESVTELGSYVAMNVDSRRVVGLITSARATDMSDHLLSEMIVTVQLLGQIREGRFERGVERYPVIGSSVEEVGAEDLDVILGSDRRNEGSRSFVLGKFAMNDRYKVYVSGKHFFSKHAAILGNSGAGKSCTVTKIIEESIKYQDSQLVLFDLHGEYRQAFCDSSGQMLRNVNYINERDLVLPYWLLTYDELASLFVDKSDPRLISNQRSLLSEALLKLKRPAARELGLEETYNVDTPIYFSLNQLQTYASNLNEARFVLNTNRYAFSRTALRNLSEKEQAEIMLTQRVKFNQGQPEGEIKHALYHQKLNGLEDLLYHKLNDRRYDFLLRPTEHAGRSEKFSEWIPEAKDPDQANWSDSAAWLVNIITGQLKPRRNLTIIDLSGIPFDIVDITVGLLTRIVFDYNFYSPSDRRRPVALIYEEAHNYVPRENNKHSFARLAVERVAKEGRKYGVSCIMVSQRPSDLSHTVLSQCNNLIVMRLSNPEDQAYVTKVVSDQFAELVKMLPSLRQGEAFVIGDSVIMPLRTLIQLPSRQPSSEDIDFFERWSQEYQSSNAKEVVERLWRQERKY